MQNKDINFIPAHEILPGHVYRHFKGNKYIVLDIVEYSEDENEKMVIYQALYAPGVKYARPLSMFASEVDHEKYPEVRQKYRFEEIDV
ncbi:DUF1653 domain-containing protein [Candidatus Saccharibacteria bacterium]|nr:DUF1653 domain-containing protein [Candidatus Saccharibacteria bacterium]